MPSSHRETCFSGKNPAVERGSSAATLQPCEEQILRSKEAAVDEPTTKRQKIDENRNVSGQIEVFRASASASCSDSNGRELRLRPKFDESGGDGVNGAIVEDLRGGNELGDVRAEMKNNVPMFRDFMGSHDVISELKSEVILPLYQLKLVRHFGLEPLARILLHGPPGCGKTFLARAIGNEAGLPFYETSGAALMAGGVSGILELFCREHKNAPSIVFIDEIDAMTPKTESLTPCPVKQLMACMDEPINDDADCESPNRGPGYVLVIGATNRPDALDPALRKRFDREFFIGVPCHYARRNILDNLKHKHKFENGNRSITDPRDLARLTQGYVGRDLVALVKKASMAAVNRLVREKDSYREMLAGVPFKDRCRLPFSDEELENLRITMADFVSAGSTVPPSAKMEDFCVTPIAKWDDVGGLQSLKLVFERNLVKRLKYPRVFKDLRAYNVSLSNIMPRQPLPDPFFLYGPSGCGKTLIVEALAKEAGTNFMHIKAPQLVEFGELSEWVVGNIFNYAKAHPPCIVFFDQLTVAPSGGEEEDSDCEGIRGWPWPDFRQLSSVLRDLEYDGEPLEGVYVIGASNSPEILHHMHTILSDIARIKYVPLPTPEERGEILKCLARDKPIDADVDLMALGKDVACKNFSGADLATLMRNASKIAIDRPSLSRGGHMTIKDADFKSALAKISPGLSFKHRKIWEHHSEEMVHH